MYLKKWICTLVVIILLINLMSGTAMASSVGHGMLTGRHEDRMTMQLVALASNDTGPSLAPGNHELWIDRIDQLPDYARSFYVWMETNAKDGGMLMDPTRATCIKGESGNYDTYLYRFHTIQGSTDFTFSGYAHKDAAQAALTADLGDAATVAFQYAIAVYGAFDRDHPEVFWLGGNMIFGYDIPYDYDYSMATHTGTVNYNVNLYFYLQTPDYDVRSAPYQSLEAINDAIEKQDAAVETILSGCTQSTTYEQVRYLNNTLTRINAYNSATAAGNSSAASVDAWKSISALTGSTGTEGPVCEGYSRAMMILCRELGIPCVLAEGNAISSVGGTPGGHMWNYVQLEGAWYAVDVTWNDPFVVGSETKAISGYETENWLLVGSNTVVMNMTFDTSHVLTNHTTQNSLCYTNGPVLSQEAYTPEPEITVPTLTLKAPTLEFRDMISIDVFFTAENTEDVVEMGMITYKENVDTWDVQTADYVIPGATYDVASGRYYACSQGIHAKYLSDTVYLACYAKLTDGSYVYSRLVPYSPITYATNQLQNSDNIPLKQLVAAMLNYGAAAQTFFGHNAEQLANSGMTEEQQLLPESYREDMVQAVPAASVEKQGSFVNNSGFTSRNPAISFEGAFSINYFFTPRYAPVDGITMYYWNEADYNNAEVLTPENASGQIRLEDSGTGKYRGDITGISAKNISQAVYVAAVYSDGTDIWSSGVLGYSIGAYCANQSAKGADVAPLAEATAIYGYYARQYFG